MASTKGKPKRITALGVPKTDRERKFCQRWIEHFDAKRAYIEAGYGDVRRAATCGAKLLERFKEFLRPYQEAKARKVAEQLALDQDVVLKQMARKAVFDPADFVETAPTPKTRKVKGENGQEREEVIEWYGEPVYASRLKPFDKLTPEQRLAVEIVGDSGGEVRYRLPKTTEQHTYLTSLGRQFGMFTEKLIMERHIHKHAHAHLELTNVPTAKLRELTQQLLPLVGQDYAQQMGFTMEEIQEAIANAEPVAEQGVKG